ncbi:YdcF family protein [Roseimaritima sediminicola]|uniref:YdcF family protein n=1 Tax=Roseimaritima sediminicola TaxID=2662066 RepID=UPI0012983F92|nr:ElyC/SanA/YdcF family protein [Roseimaritima sediminicola]
MSNETPLRTNRHPFFVAAAIAAGIGIALFVADRSVLEKTLTSLAMPVGLVWLSLTFAGALLAWRREAAFKWVAVPWLLLTVAGNGWVAKQSVETLEGPYLNVQPLQAKPLRQIVVLGGGTSQAANGQVQTTRSGDRVVLAARMYHLGLTDKLICTGVGIKSLSGDAIVGGEAARKILLDLDVPADVITVIGGRNTSEEMIKIKELLGEEPVGIVTSASHLGRAMRLAENQGLNAVPLPANFLSPTSDRPTPWGRVLRDSIPNASALETNTRVAKEYLAWAVGR